MKIILFFNNFKGISVYKALTRKNYKILKIFLSYKNLNPKIIKELNKNKINYQIIRRKKFNSLNLEIKKLSPDLNIIAGFPYIFPKKLISTAKLGTINLHSGALPKYRGGSPLSWQIINNEKFIKFAIIKINKGIDTGNIIVNDKFKLKFDYTIKDVHNIVNRKFQRLIIKALDKIKKRQKNFIPQRGKINYFKQRTPSDGEISWKSMNNLQVYNFIRALSCPYSGAFSYYKRKKILIYKSKISKKKVSIPPGNFFSYKKKMYVKCSKGLIQLLKINCKLPKRGFFNN